MTHKLLLPLLLRDAGKEGAVAASHTPMPR
jgi:hypothetical protein